MNVFIKGQDWNSRNSYEPTQTLRDSIQTVKFWLQVQYSQPHFKFVVLNYVAQISAFMLTSFAVCMKSY